LRKYKFKLKNRGKTTTKPGTLLKNRIPVLWFHKWWEDKPVFREGEIEFAFKVGGL